MKIVLIILLSIVVSIVISYLLMELTLWYMKKLGSQLTDEEIKEICFHKIDRFYYGSDDEIE